MQAEIGRLHEPANALARKLANTRVLTGTDEAALQRLGGPARIVAAGQGIVEHGDPPSDLHLVLDGIALRYKLVPDGSRQIVGLLLPGDFCDLHIAVLGAMDYSIAALTDCTIANVAEKEVNAVMQAHPRVARALWWAMLVDEGILREWLTGLGRRDAVTRMAHLFCEMLIRLRSVGLTVGESYAMPLTQVDMADILGLTSVHVSRSLRELREAGLIVLDSRLKSRQVTVPDEARLQAFCHFDPTYLHLGGD